MISHNLPSYLKNPIRLQKLLIEKNEEYWMRKGEVRALELFQQMSKRVPAYKDFLKKNTINPDKIKTIKDFKNVPTIDKDNYLREYSLEGLCWDGNLAQDRWVYSSTSGSTGEPFYFPRQDLQDWYYAITAELYLRSNFDIHKKSTLYIDGFAMGPWIGGLFTYQAVKSLAERGQYDISIITAGVSKEEIYKAVKKLGPHYDQVIIGGYPPFVKDAIDYGLSNGLNWSKYNLGFIFSAEGFSEEFRNYIYKKAGLKSIYKDTLNHYGTVDLGTMSHETPLSILVRRLSLQDKELYTDVFSDAYKLPTLTQYVPEMFFFEENNGSLICSSFSGLPLVRYDLKDNGGIFTLKDIKNKFLNRGIDLDQKMKELNLLDTQWNLPFVYIYERKDFSVVLSGANIYPETIRKALQQAELEKAVTGKFTMLVKHDKNQDPFLEINIELKPRIESNSVLKDAIRSIVMKRLLSENSEYKVLHQHIPQRVAPKIILWEYENPQYFNAGGKQKWVKK